MTDLETQNKGGTLPIKWLVSPPLFAFIIFVLLTNASFSDDIHSGGALFAWGIIFIVTFVGFIVEIIAVPKAVFKVKRNKDLQVKLNYFYIFIGVLHILAGLFFIGVIIYSFLPILNA